jgi:hypothetical protein
VRRIDGGQERMDGGGPRSGDPSFHSGQALGNRGRQDGFGGFRALRCWVINPLGCYKELTDDEI